jgi:hypothetical protein
MELAICLEHGKSTRGHRWESPFSPFANGKLAFVSSPTNGKTTKFRLLDEQTLNGLRENFTGLPFSVGALYVRTGALVGRDREKKRC